MRKTAIASVIVLQSLLSACAEKDAAPAQPLAKAITPVSPAPVALPAAPIVSNDTLMKAIYGEGWHPAEHEAVVRMSDPENREKDGTFVVTALAQTTLKTGETVLVTNGAPADEDGYRSGAFLNSGLLSVYLLRKVNDEWTVIKRHDSVTTLGSDSKIGKAKWVELGKDRPGLAILSRNEQQGYLEFLSLFDLKADVMHDLTGSPIMSESSNEDGCNFEADYDCWTTIGKWKLVPSATAGKLNDIVFTFDHDVSKRPKDAAGKPAEFRETTDTKVAARYAFDGKQYRLVSGTNPTQGF